MTLPLWTSLSLHFSAAFGVAFVLGWSEISLPWRLMLARSGWLGRWLVALLECPACIGFHLGWASLWLGMTQLPIEVRYGLLLAFATAASNLVLARIAGLSGENT